MKRFSFWLRVGSAGMAIGIILGAFAAHALKQQLEPRFLEAFETGVRYHLIHCLGLLLVGILLRDDANPKFVLAGQFLLGGILLFSGSLYLLAFFHLPIIGAITPIGGVSFILGWIVLIVGLQKNNDALP